MLLHGVGAWNAQVAAFAADNMVIAPDMPGHGESKPFQNTPILADYTDRLAEAIEALVAAIGHSMGALILLLAKMHGVPWRLNANKKARSIAFMRLPWPRQGLLWLAFAL